MSFTTDELKNIIATHGAYLATFGRVDQAVQAAGRAEKTAKQKINDAEIIRLQAKATIQGAKVDDIFAAVKAAIRADESANRAVRHCARANKRVVTVKAAVAADVAAFDNLFVWANETDEDIRAAETLKVAAQWTEDRLNG